MSPQGETLRSSSIRTVDVFAVDLWPLQRTSAHDCARTNVPASAAVGCLLLVIVLAHMCQPVRQLVATAVGILSLCLLMNVIEPVLFAELAKVDLEDARLLARPAVEGQCIAGRNWVAHWVVSPGRRVCALSLREPRQWIVG